MKPNIPSEAEVTAEALDILIKHLPPSKMALLMATWKIGSGDYVQTRDQLFEGATMESLFEEMRQTLAERKSSKVDKAA